MTTRRAACAAAVTACLLAILVVLVLRGASGARVPVAPADPVERVVPEPAAPRHEGRPARAVAPEPTQTAPAAADSSPSPREDEPPWRIRCVDELTGAPVHGRDLSIHHRPGVEDCAASVVLADGEWTLRRPRDGERLEATVGAPGFLDAVVTLDPSRSETVVRLSRGGVVRGVVCLKETGAPAAAAEVWIGVTRHLTDRSGCFEAPCIPWGTAASLFVRHGDLVVTNFRAPAVTREHPVAEVRVELAQNGRIDVRVVDERGEAVAGARIEIAEQRPPFARPVIVTDASGQASIAGLRIGVYAAAARAPGRAEVVDRDVTVGGVTTEVEFMLLPQDPVTVRGRVTDEAGRPVPDVTIRDCTPAGTGTSTVTDGDGRFVLRDLRPPPATLSPVGGPGSELIFVGVSRPGWVNHVFAVPPTGVLECRITRPVTFVGQVVDAEGRAVGEFDAVHVPQAGGSGGRFARTGPPGEGRFTVSEVVGGEGVLRVRTRVGIESEVPVSAPAGSRVDVGTIRLEEGGRIEARILWEDGTPCPAFAQLLVAPAGTPHAFRIAGTFGKGVCRTRAILEAQSYDVRVVSSEDLVFSRVDDLPVEKGRSSQVTISASRGAVVVVRPEGTEAVTPAIARLTPLARTAHELTASRGGWDAAAAVDHIEAPVSTRGALAEAVLRRIPPGRYRCDVLTSGDVTIASLELALAPGELRVVEVPAEDR